MSAHECFQLFWGSLATGGQYIRSSPTKGFTLEETAVSMVIASGFSHLGFTMLPTSTHGGFAEKCAYILTKILWQIDTLASSNELLLWADIPLEVHKCLVFQTRRWQYHSIG